MALLAVFNRLTAIGWPIRQLCAGQKSAMYLGNELGL
jgi:hypothetical protein